MVLIITKVEGRCRGHTIRLSVETKGWLITRKGGGSGSTPIHIVRVTVLVETRTYYLLVDDLIRNCKYRGMFV